MLDLRHLRALHAVVTTGSVRAAAAHLGYTPSAVSQHVTALERQTASVLLEPAGRGVRATAAGLLLSQHAASLLDGAAEAEAALAALAAGERGVLRMASFATAGGELVPRALAQTSSTLPGLRISLRVAERDDALTLLRRGDLDLAVIEDHENPTVSDSLVRRRLLTDPFRIVLPRGHRLARKRGIDLADTAEESWIRLACEIDCCLEATDAAFAQAGFMPDRAVEAHEYWPAQGFVAAGLGLALIPALALSVLHSGVAVRKLSGAAQPVRHAVAVTRQAVIDTAPVRTMIAALEAEAASYASG
ncbi:LysR substrate-binding domain-containing protein [Umezawaea sp. Da 62-37]|uniref:LysR family transcriptional regulator n=1 Tax=Umezawaea sp. Da 62-37 TaxID=3075927 RepID=UPI0028F70461|nr:LysR substrate-binding domain-containing protein [Umezawaea sp. Da 62-37]WNV87757.1 LysR substrate-binding domain-containing protein [Umezawaea sp. Da 62-37]